MFFFMFSLFLIVESYNPDCFKSCNEPLKDMNMCKPWVRNCNTESCEANFCLPQISYNISTTTLTVAWTDHPDPYNSKLAYIVLLYNDNNECEQFEYQHCKHCTKNFFFKKSFYSSCKSKKVVQPFTFKASFDNLKYNKEYIIYVVTLAKQSQEQITNVPLKTKSQECYHDCYDADYHGIRSISEIGNRCLTWKDGRSNFCKMKDKSRPWCMTKSGQEEFCDVRKCANHQRNSECITEFYSTTSTTSIIKWKHPPNSNEAYSYVILLYNNENTCERFAIQCDRCSLSWYIIGYLNSCKSKLELMHFTGEHVFENLEPDKEYIIYLLTISKDKSYQNINKVYLKTKPEDKELSKPTNLMLVDFDLHSLSFKWNFDETYNYIVNLTKSFSNTKIMKNVTINKEVEFFDLEVCTEYCLIVSAVKNRRQSSPSNKLCSYTSSPIPGSVIINDIGSISSSTKIVSWKYYGSIACSIYYEVQYYKVDDYLKSYEVTNHTNIFFENLEIEKLYAVRVRAKTNMVVKNYLQSGPYSDTKYMQVNAEEPTIEDYKENVNGLGTEVNISWTMKKDLTGSIFEYLVLLKDSSKRCVASVSLKCSCHQNNDNEKYSKEFKKSINLFQCREKETNSFDKDQHILFALLKKGTQLTQFYINIHAITPHKIYEIYKRNQDIINKDFQDFLELERVINTYSSQLYTHCKVESHDFNIKILQRGPLEVTLRCILGRLVNLEVELRSNNNVINVPFNMSCGMKHPKNIIRNFTNNINGKVYHLYWNVTIKGSHKYIIIWMNKDGHFKEYVETEFTSYSLTTAKENNGQQICIATMDNTWSTSKYTCTRQSQSPGSIMNLKSYSTSKEVYIVWQKSEEDVHHGYVVNILQPSGLCNSTIINMESYNLKLKLQCLNKNEKRWRFLKSFQIKDLVPDTKYKISISSVKGNYISEPTIVMVKTKREESVSNLKISDQDLHVQVTFQPPKTMTSNIVYRLKLTLRGLKVCTLKYNVIYDNVIINTTKLIPVYYSVSCFEYEVEVVPVRQCNTNEKCPDDSDVEYTPLIIKGFFKNYTTHESNLNDINLRLLSLNLLKVSWSMDIINNTCSTFGFFVHIYQLMNKKDCKSWIIAQTTCSTLNDDLLKLKDCQNKEYIRYDPKVMKSHMLLHGVFEASKEYKVNVWKISNPTSNLREIKQKIVRYENDGACIDDCQRKKEIIENDDCTFINSQVSSKNYTYENNICKVTTSKVVLFCYNKDAGHKAQCDTTNCVSTIRNDKCAQNIRIFSNSTSITIKLPDISQKKSITGFILVLYDLKKTCIRLNKINITVDDMSALSFQKDCIEYHMIKWYNNTSTFTGLQPHQQYFIYIYPFLDEEVFGVISHFAVATTMSSPMTKNYIEVNRTNTSLTFKWNSYKKKENNEYFVRYIVRLENFRSREARSVNVSNEMVEFHKLEVCTKYCMFLTVLHKNNSLDLVDYICNDTLSSNLGLLTINNIKSGASSTREISWSYSGSEDCPKTYVVQIYNKNKNLTVYKDTIDMKISIKDLEINTTYRVIVGIKRETFLNNDVDNVNYSDMQVFYTGTVIENEVKVYVNFNNLKNSLSTILTSKSKGWTKMFAFIFQIWDQKQKCSISLIAPPDSNMKDYEPILSEQLKISWNKYKNCPIKSNCIFDLSDKFVHCDTLLENAVDKSKLRLYGLSVLRVQELNVEF